MKPKGRQMMAWLLTVAVTLSGNSFTVLADEMDVQVQQETSENEEEIFAAEEAETVQDEAVDTEESEEISFDEEVQDEIQIEDTEDSESESEEEIQIEEAADDSENLILEMQDDISVFSSGEDTLDSEEYKIWFENLRDGEYSTYFFDNEDGELRLNTENLNGKNASISWEVGYRLDDQNGSREDGFTTMTDLPENMIFWSENAEDNSVIEINGAKLQEACRWLNDNKGDEYWFEVRAYVNIEGGDEPVYLEQAGLNSREHVEDYHLPEDEVILTDWNYWVGRYNYNCYVENKEHLSGDNITLELTDVSVANAPEEEDETPVCEIDPAEADGWNIRAKRLGTAVVTLTYKDISGKEQQYNFKIYVNADKFTLEPQWAASGSNMLKNSEMTVSFVLRHEWKTSDDRQESEDMTGWTLELDPDENGYAYDTNLLDVAVSGEEHTITISSKDNAWGTGIALRALHPSDDESEEPTYSYVNIYVEVCEEYDVLYPERIGNIDAGDALDFNNCGLRVEHIRGNEEPSIRGDVTYDFEYDTNQWTNEAAEGQLPILRRKTADGTQINVIARDGDGAEIRSREYWFDNLDYSIRFENLKEGDYSTYFFRDENGELKLNTDKLNGKNASVSWEVGYRTNDENGGDDQFTSDMNLPEDMIFWSETNDNSILEIKGEKLWNACKWLDENVGGNFWFEARASVKIGEETVYMAQAGINTRDTREDYYLPENEVILMDADYWINKNYNGYVQNQNDPDGRDFDFTVTDVNVSNSSDEVDETPVCEVNGEDENGWNIHANRFGTAVVTLTYEKISGEEAQHSFELYVNSDRFILETQWPTDGSRMLKNSETKLSFILYHDWRRSDEDQGAEEVEDWTLEFAPDENGDAYDKNLLKSVEINGHELTVKSGEETWGTDILLKAVIPSEDGKGESVAYDNPHIEVCEEYDVICPESIGNIDVGDVLDFNNCDLKVEHIKENEEPYIRDDVTFDFEYDTNLWTNEASEDQLPILRRNTTDVARVNVIARDGDGNEIDRREYVMDELDYSVWFANMRHEGGTYFFVGETGELQLNTENLKDKNNVSIEWEVGYRTEEDENENDQFTPVPTSQKFWSEKKGDDSVLVINGTKLYKADRWLEENDRREYWFEARAYIKINGTEVFTCRAALSGKEVIEEYYINFGETLESVPGETTWINQSLNCYVENPEHPWGELVQTKITKVKTFNKEIYSIAYLKNGWRMKAEKPGETKIEVTYTDIHGNQQKGIFNISVTDVFYWCIYMPKNNSDAILANEEKSYELSVYRRDAKNLDRVEVDSSKYEFELIEGSYNENVVDYVNIEGNTLTIKAKEDVQDEEIFVGIRAVSKERDDEDNPLWSAETQIYAYVVRSDSTQIRLKELVDTNPKVGEQFDLNEKQPGIFRYNNETQEWVDIQEDENVRLCMEYDKTVWKAVNEEAIPILQRIAPEQSTLRLIAEERHIDRYGNEVWERIAEESCYFPTSYDKDEKCSHLWETVIDVKGNCGKAEKRHQICTACQERKALSDIPATGKHKWSKYTVTKKATVFAQGQETRTCSVCKKKETRKTAKLKAALNLSAYSFPLQRGRTVTIKASGLKNGDYVRQVTSARSSVLRAVKLKNGDIRLTAQRSTNRRAVNVKVLVKTAGGASRTITVTVQSNQVATRKITGVARNYTVKRGKTITLKPVRDPFTSQDRITYASSNKRIVTVDARGRVKGIRTGSAVITVKAGRAVYRTVIKVTK